jgi:hypothetical protein
MWRSNKTMEGELRRITGWKKARRRKVYSHRLPRL